MLFESPKKRAEYLVPLEAVTGTRKVFFNKGEKMAFRWNLAFLFGFLVFAEINCQKAPPQVNGNFKATGEMVETLEDESHMLTQMAFEESYDDETKNAAFRVHIVGKNVTFLENFKTNQTFRYDEENCTLVTRQQWIETKTPPSLLPYEDTNGTVRFSLKQLFLFDNTKLKEYDVAATFRGMPARKWMYEIKGNNPVDDEVEILSVYAYWSDGTWNTTSPKDTTPLGYIISKMRYVSKSKTMKVHEQFINIYSFVPDTVDQKLFEPIQGRVCEKRVQTIPFPNVNNFRAVALHSEFLFPDYLEIRYIDTWLDTLNKVIRMDMERIKNDVPLFQKKARKYQSETILAPMGVVFQLAYDKGLFKCNVINLTDFDYDVQNLFDYKAPPKDWGMAQVFGANKTTYVYIGKTSKRDIPCHMFQGVRTDWPGPSANVTSLWEWCFSENMTKKQDVVTFRNSNYGLIYAQIKILESPDKGMFYNGLRLIHHFYDVNKRDPAIMHSTNFDISMCFSDTEKRYMQFVVDWPVTDDNIHLVVNATSDATFLQRWRNAVYAWSGLQPYSLRVSKVQAVVMDKKLFIRFVYLDVHTDLPEEIKKKEKTPYEAEIEFRKNIHTGKVFVSYQPTKDSKMMRLLVVNNSLEFQVNRTFIVHTLPPTSPETPTTTRKIPFTLRTEPDKDVTTGSSVSSSSRTTPVSSTRTSHTSSSSTQPSSKGSSPTPVSSTSISSDSTGSSTANSKTTQYISSSTFSPTGKTLKSEQGHKAGTVAGVSIGMLLVGISVGSAGIFIKFNGLPTCLRR